MPACCFPAMSRAERAMGLVRAEALDEALRSIPLHYAIATVFRYGYNLSYAELARNIGNTKEGARKITERGLKELQEKLNKPQPPEKKVYRYRLYQDKWALGDVFAYRFTSEYSKEQGFYGQYVIFRKVSESYWYPGHIVPVVEFYCWIGKEIPSLSEICINPIMPTAIPSPYREKYRYRFSLLSTSERVIPKGNLTLLGNKPGDDLVPYNGDRFQWLHGAEPLGWEGTKWNNTIEHVIIGLYRTYSNYYAENPNATV